MSGEGVSVNGNKGTMEGISELLRCYICMERLSNATICPHCSKLGCFTCIKRWVTDNRSNCPHCRKALTLRDLIKIPLFDDLGQVLDNLHACTKNLSNSSSPREENCKIHHQKMSVYCETCKECICHECALWSTEHHGHSFKPLDILYKKHVEILQGELAKLKDRMKVILNQVQHVEKKIEGVKNNKSKTKKEVAHSVEKICHRLDEVAKEKIVILNECRHYLRSQAVEITKESHELEKTVASGNISSLIDSNGELKSEVSATIKKLLTASCQMDLLPTMSNFVNEVVPEYESSVFKITSFRDLQRRGEEVYSEPLELQGLVWRLKVYPNGHKEEVGNYLAVFVELSEGYSRVTNYQYCIEMLYGCTNKFPNRNHRREYASDFADGESWGYRKYYELSRLQEDGYIKDDTLVLRFSIRTPTYYQKFQDQTLYLDKVVKERDALKLQLQAAKQQISTLKNDRKALLTDRRQNSGSRTVPSQHDNYTPIPIHSSQHIPRHSQHHHRSNSAHHDQHRRERSSLMDADENQARAVISHPPPSMTRHQSPSHNPIHSSPKRSPYHPDSRILRGDARMLSTGEPLISGSHRFLGRRSSNELSPNLHSVAEQRRRSADPAVFHDQEFSSHHDLRISQTHRNFNRKHKHPQPQPMAKAKEKIRPKFKGSSSSDELESGNSQHWDQAVNPADITITLNDEDGEKSKSTSSSSTLINSGSPPREFEEKLSTRQQQQKQQELSQEPFGDDDQKEMLSLSSLAVASGGPVPLSNFPVYYDSYSYFGELSHSKQEHNQPHCQGLSQPTYPLPPKSHHGKSLTDLTSSNLSYSQQFLSQSLADFQHMQLHQRDIHRYSESTHQVGDSRLHHDHRFRSHQSQLQHMSSDSHLNKSHIPGLQVSIISALSDVREEEMQRRQGKGKKSSPVLRAASQLSQTRHPISLQKKHVNATMVKTTEGTNSQISQTKRKVESSKYLKGSPEQARDRPLKSHEKQSALECGNGEESQVNNSPQTSLSRGLSSKVKSKSNSTSSLNNLSQIL